MYGLQLEHTKFGGYITNGLQSTQSTTSRCFTHSTNAQIEILFDSDCKIMSSLYGCIETEAWRQIRRLHHRNRDKDESQTS